MSQHDRIKPEDALTQADYETLAAFRHALRRFASFSSAAAKQAGLTTQQHQALLAIKGAPAGTSMTVGRLAEDLMLAPHTAAELVTRLEAADLVAKRDDPADRRRTVLTLRPQAEDKLRALTLVHRREVRQLAPRLLALFRDLEA
ncbi:DNA-binding transcriptional regulator, MarR family [Beijerinckiaceae bacterium RH AL1]|nr:helix-turn-helix domain-containing protein [Beijerinckiaceae bacterium]VVB49144.1 DNA-binding transcriptional regulator, MarR family [Beijerinckiaceae bacterium RH CH11]VVB49223.1 DNA-binding transcriptional regulator, MarR family [Beijerinckiaceae bacterium RH AL8]VVC56750.1 DNA-binding transcriptional regulator, MarR family [Beijerinckiaceae bacterium RH AL1]